MEIRVPFTSGILCLPVGSRIIYNHIEYECIECPPTLADEMLSDEDNMYCKHCGASSYLCFLSACFRTHRPDCLNVYYKSIAINE